MRAALCRRCLCKQLHAHGRGCSASFARCGVCANACRLLGSPASVCGSAQLSSGCPCGFSLPLRFFGVFFFFLLSFGLDALLFFFLTCLLAVSQLSQWCLLFFTKAASYGGGGSDGAQRMRVRCRTHQRAGLRVLGPFGTRLHLRHTGFSSPARRAPGGEHRCSGDGVGKSQSCWGVVSGQFWAGFGSVRWIASW